MENEAKRQPTRSAFEGRNPLRFYPAPLTTHACSTNVRSINAQRALICVIERSSRVERPDMITFYAIYCYCAHINRITGTFSETVEHGNSSRTSGRAIFESFEPRARLDRSPCAFFSPASIRDLEY